MTTAVIEQIIFVPGNPDARGLCCITDRENPTHCWIRAEAHCYDFLQFSFHVRMSAATTCRHVAEAVRRIPRPPQRSLPIRWGWGNFSHLKIDNRRPR
ncbi:MAG: hypothetical protein WAM58_08135 [Candidatus Acidiferrum sp.]